jgi:hypothetical protein
VSTRPARPGVGAAAAVLLLLLTACGGGGGADSADSAAGGLASAADTSTCVRDAQPVTSTPGGYPTSFPLPDGTVVFHVEDRGQDGVIATGVTGTPFDDVLASMNAASKSGFKLTSGETEEDDAEADWSGQGFTGRWAIKKSASCPGETVIQLLSKRG